MAEESGHIIPLGYWVLNEVCLTIRSWQDKGLTLVPVSVNVSARQFQQPDFHKRVAEVLRKHGIDPSLIEIELTEGLVMEDTESAQRELAQLKKIGLRISIDDFGTGYSCLSYLRRFPIDVLKIDRSFVQEIGEQPGWRKHHRRHHLAGQEPPAGNRRRGRRDARPSSTTCWTMAATWCRASCSASRWKCSLIEPLLAALEQGDTDSTGSRARAEGLRMTTRQPGSAELSPELQRTLEASGVGVYSFDAATGRFVDRRHLPPAVRHRCGHAAVAGHHGDAHPSGRPAALLGGRRRQHEDAAPSPATTAWCTGMATSASSAAAVICSRARRVHRRVCRACAST